MYWTDGRDRDKQQQMARGNVIPSLLVQLLILRIAYRSSDLLLSLHAADLTRLGVPIVRFCLVCCLGTHTHGEACLRPHTYASACRIKSKRYQYMRISEHTIWHTVCTFQQICLKHREIRYSLACGSNIQPIRYTDWLSEVLCNSTTSAMLQTMVQNHIAER